MFLHGNRHVDLGNFFKQKVRSTWWHLRYGSEHELDHMLMRQSDRWYLEGCKTLHFGRALKGKTKQQNRRIEAPQVQRPDWVLAWRYQPDHQPVEITIEVARDWRPEARD